MEEAADQLARLVQTGPRTTEIPPTVRALMEHRDKALEGMSCKPGTLGAVVASKLRARINAEAERVGSPYRE